MRNLAGKPSGIRHRETNGIRHPCLAGVLFGDFDVFGVDVAAEDVDGAVSLFAVLCFFPCAGDGLLGYERLALEIEATLCARGDIPRLHRRFNGERTASAEGIGKRFFAVTVGVVEGAV